MPEATRSILVLEDSPTQAERLRSLLAEHGYKVTVVTNGVLGLDALRQEMPDLVISDVLMPELDGFSFCRLMKSDESTRHIPLMLLTTENSPLDVIVGLERGADNFITKPYDPEYLLRTVQQILEGVRLRREGLAPEEGVLHIGERKITVPSDRRQIVELLASLAFSTDEKQQIDSQVLTNEYSKQVNQLDRIRDALDSDRFVLYYQPILDIQENLIASHEMLLRMVGEDGEIIPPSAFLPLAESSGMISRIDLHVMNQAVDVLRTHNKLARPPRLSINMSGRTLLRPSVVERMADNLALADIDPSFLTMEITETSIISNLTKAAKSILILKDHGCHFALDDFGIGYASMDYVKHLPVDIIKIDGSFVRDMSERTTDRRLVQAMTKMAHDLGKQVVAEFVGDQVTLDLLREYEVDFAQGYFIGRPSPDLVGEP